MKHSARPTVGYVLKMFPRLSETFILKEIQELERQGLSLHIFSLKRPVEAMAAEQVRLRAPISYLPERVWREPLRVLRGHWGVARAFPRGYWSTWMHVLRGRAFKSLPRALRRFSQTCCLVHEMGQVRHLHAHFATDPSRLASWAQMICQIPFSVSTHAKDVCQGNRDRSPGLQFKLLRARFVIANSGWSASKLRAAIATTPIYTIYNGVDLGSFTLRQEEPEEPLILSVGRLVEKKGFPTLVQACQYLSQWGVPFRCEIIGAGPQEQDLKNLIRIGGLHHRVCLLGPMPHKGVRACYHRAMVFAMPCIQAADGDRDILPNVLKEAMAVGVPVITSNLEGIEELITDGESGLLVPPGDPEALARMLEGLLTDAPLRRRLAARARTVIEDRFDSRKNFVKLNELLLEAMTEASHPLAASQDSQIHEPAA